MTKRIPSRHRRRPLLGALVGVVLLASCSGGSNDEQGVATAQAASSNFCDALADLIATSKEGGGEDASGLERDARAVLEVVPDDAPGEVTDFLEAIGEMSELSQVWENPATGGIKDEYVDDLQRLTGALEEKAPSTGRFASRQCPGLAITGDGPLSGLGGSGNESPAPGGTGSTTGPTTAAATGAAKAVALLENGPAAVYERVTVDVGRVTATNADPTGASGPDAPATTTNSLLVDVDLTATSAATNVFSAADFRLERPGGAPVSAETLVDKGDEPSSLQLKGRDSVRATVVFRTDSLVRNLRGYALRIDRKDRVPAVVPLSGTAAAPLYPAKLEAGATGTFASPYSSSCTDRFQSAVRSATADLDADLESFGGVKRALRGRRWVTIVLQVTNATPAGRTCPATSGSYSFVELRLQADGRAVAPSNPESFDSIPINSSADETHVFEVEATVRELKLTGPAGEVLGSWKVDLPAAPGEG